MIVGAPRPGTAPGSAPGEPDPLPALLAELESWVEPAADPLDAMVRTALLPPGRLLRPLLVLRSAAVVGGPIEHALPAAAAVEMVHAASLVHDDIIDQDDPRRGRPSAHRRYGRDRAVLLGDALIFRVFTALSACRERGADAARVVEAAAELSRAGTDLCRGVVRELDGGAHGPTMDGPEYPDTARLKPAVLLRAACRVGAIIGGGNREQTDRLGRFGSALGAARRIREDLLPFVAHPCEPGVPAPSGLANRHPTLPLLLARQAGSAEDRRLLRCLVHGVTDPDPAANDEDVADRFDRLREVLDRTGALAAATALMHRWIESALTELAGLPDGAAHASLTDLVRSVGELPAPTHTERAGLSPSGV